VLQVQRDYEELPAEAVPQLRESLFALISKFARGAPPVRTQLCLAMAALAAHCPAASWTDSNGGSGVLRWLVAKFAALPAETAMPCMLELLTVLPQVGEGPLHHRLVAGGEEGAWLGKALQRCMLLAGVLTASSPVPPRPTVRQPAGHQRRCQRASTSA
jgi:hypothetical protein